MGRVLNKTASFKLKLTGIPAETQQFEYPIDDEFFKVMESSEILGGSLKVVLKAKRTQGKSYELHFAINGTIKIVCDRCLDEMPYDVDTTYDLLVKHGEEYNDEDDELLIIPESENEVDLSHVIYDTIALTIPLKHVHPEGECNEEMSAKLREHGFATEDDDKQEEREVNDPRWSALRNLLDNNKNT